MNRTAIIGLSTIAIVALGASGYALQRHLTCATMEEDYLNAFSTVRNSGALYAAQDKQLDAIARRLEAEGRRKLESLTADLSSTCGNRAMETALRKAGDSVRF